MKITFTHDYYMIIILLIEPNSNAIKNNQLFCIINENINRFVCDLKNSIITLPLDCNEFEIN